MYNIEQENTNTKLIQNTEEKTDTVEIDQISDIIVNVNNTQINVPECNESITDNKRKESGKVTLDTELEDVIKKANELELKCTVFQLVDKERQLPSLWVQYNQSYYQQSDRGYEGLPLEDPESRTHFIKWVFIILFLLQFLTVAAPFIFDYMDYNKFYNDNFAIITISCGSMLIAMNFLIACSSCVKHPFCIYIFIFIGVIVMNIFLFPIHFMNSENILITIQIDALITVFACVLLACCKFQLHIIIWYIYVIVVSMSFIWLLITVLIGTNVLNIVLVILGSLIQAILYILELQMILSNRTIEIEEDQYALAAYLLYTSVIDIFLKIIQFMGLMEERF